MSPPVHCFLEESRTQDTMIFFQDFLTFNKIQHDSNIHIAVIAMRWLKNLPKETFSAVLLCATIPKG